jgi:hypothetical protein
MPTREVNGYALGQRGWIDVVDSEGKGKRYLEGEIVRLMPVGEYTVWALIRTAQGTGAYRLW